MTSLDPASNNLLPPRVIHDAQTAKYIMLSTFTAVTWDWMLSLTEEYQIVRRCGMSVAVVVYFLARFSTLGLSLAYVIFHNSYLTTGSCTMLWKAMAAFSIVGTAADSYLFLLRVRAVYNYSRLITVVFGVWCFVVVGTSIILPFAMHASKLGDAQRCYVSDTPAWATIPLWVRGSYNTSVFVAISSRIASYSMYNHVSSRRVGTMAFFRGNGLPRICRDLLHGGQFFYFTTIGLTLAAAMMAILPVTSVVRSIYGPPSLALETIMTCKVFRAVVMGYIVNRENVASLPSTTLSTIPALSELGTKFTYEMETGIYQDALD